MRTGYCRLIVIATLTAIVFGACRNSGKAPGDFERHTVAEEPEVVDSSLTVRIESVGEDSLGVTDLATGKRRSFCYGVAQMEGNVKGSLAVGDTVSVVPDKGSAHIRSLVNLSELMGQWFFDMNQRRGMKFGRNGALSSINMENFSFRDWLVQNGHLVIHYVDMQQRADSVKKYWVDHSEIVSLSRDELKLRFRDSLYQCRRQLKPLKFKFGR